MTASEQDRATWATVDKRLDLHGDALRYHPRCAWCRTKGPLVPAWRMIPMPLVQGFHPELRRASAETYVCADGCAR